MAIKASTGLRNGLLITGSFKDLMDGGFLYIYSGTPPASPDDALSGNTELLQLTESDDGSTALNMETAATDGVLPKEGDESWEGTVGGGGGTATFYRHCGDPADDGSTASTTFPRLQGTVAVVGGDMNLTDVVLVNGQPFTLGYYTVGLPEAATS